MVGVPSLVPIPRDEVRTKSLFPQEELIPLHMRHVGLSTALSSHEDEFPILTRALSASKPAYDTRVNWLADGQYAPRNWFNWTQIFRQPFGVNGAVLRTPSTPFWEQCVEKKLAEHLKTIEQTLEHGRLEERTTWHIGEEGGLYPIVTRQMGGTRFYLGRDLNEFDVVELRVLRDTVLIGRTGPDVDGREAEWLTELTLVVIPKESA